MTKYVRLNRLLVDRGVLLALAVFMLYVVLAPSTVVDGDNAEFATVGAIGGRAHPSGYPAYVLYLRATSWFPGSSPAHTAAIATALLGAVLVLVLQSACRAWGARPHAASFACGIYAASPVVLRMHTEAEVFALNGLIVALVLTFSATKGPLQGMARAGALGLIAGIGLGNHLTCVLVAPVGLLGAVRAVRETTGSKALTVAFAVGGLAIGLSTYAYLAIADGPVSFGRIERFGDLLDFFLRTDYGGPGGFVPTGQTVAAATNLGALLETVGRGWLWLPGLAGIAVLAHRSIRPGTDESRWAWRLLAVSFVLAGPLLVLRFNIEPTGLGRYVCQRFHLLPLLLLCIPIATAFDEATRALQQRVPLDRLRSPALAAVLTVAVVLVLTSTSLSWLRGVHSPAMEKGVQNLLQSLPENAVVIVNSEDVCFAADYVQHVTRQRPDVEIACWVLTSRQWYIDRLARRGVPFVGGYSKQVTKAQANAILARRPLFVDRSMLEVLAAIPSHPHGTVIRLMPPGEKPPPLGDVVTLNRRLYEAYDLAYPRPSTEDDYAAVAHKRYAATWIILAKALQAAGDEQGAADAAELARQLAPSRD